MVKKQTKITTYIFAVMLSLLLVFSMLLGAPKTKAVHATEFTDNDLSGTSWHIDLTEWTAYNVWSFSINFTSNGVSYTILQCTSSAGKSTLKYDSTEVYKTSPDGDPIMEFDEQSRTISITGGTDATNSNLKAWLNANATWINAPEGPASPSTGVVENTLAATAMTLVLGAAIVFVVANGKRKNSR